MGAGERRQGRPKIVAVVADPEQRRELRVALKHGLYPVWDDLPDVKRETLLAYDQLVCGQCGNLRSECSDEGVQWHPRTSVCHATAASVWGQRRLEETYANKLTPDGASYLDGRWVWVSPDVPPDGEDEFAEDASAAGDTDNDD